MAAGLEGRRLQAQAETLASSGSLPRYHGTGGSAMTITVAHLQPFIALIAGILILLIPRLLNFIVAIYLILVGVTGLWPRLLH
jgi:Protein of unknown function (DUF3096)